MVNVFGNNIVSAFTNGVSVKEIYTYGEKVWPTEPPVPPTPPSSGYFILWMPSNISGTFSINGSTYNLEDYSGCFSDFEGTITRAAFRDNSKITWMSTNAIRIESQAFNGCSSLSIISLPNCISLEEFAFQSCRLTYVSLPVCESVNGFEWCKGLLEVDAPACISTFGAFMGCDNLVSVSLPNCVNLSAYTFASCYNLSRVELPNCKKIDVDAFYKCSSLTYISIPECISIYSIAFGDCIKLTHIELPKCRSINTFAFGWCSSLVEVTVGTSVVCSAGGNIFIHTPIESGTGSIYVPASLVDAYKSAENWSQYSSRIFPIQN